MPICIVCQEIVPKLLVCLDEMMCPECKEEFEREREVENSEFEESLEWGDYFGN